MNNSRQTRLVLITAPNLRTARKLSRLALESRLVACVNIIPAIESHYWWKGKVDHANEVLMLLKTTAKQLRRLEKLMCEQHPYDTPEFVAIAPGHVAGKYLAWWLASTQ